MAEKAADKLLKHHPLQRLPSPSRGASAVLHVSLHIHRQCHTTAHASTTSHWALHRSPTPSHTSCGTRIQCTSSLDTRVSDSSDLEGSNDSYGWHMQYLTIIGLALATATFTVGLLADLTLSHRLFQLKNFLSVASAPIECLISVLYWGLRAVW